MFSKTSAVAHGATSCVRRHLSFLVAAACSFAFAAMLAAPAADARITKIQITTKESPTFGGFSFGAVGQYEKLVGKAFGVLDPNDPHNSVIVDIALAPRNSAGLIEYSFDFYILKPIDLSKGNHKVFYEPPNRGGKQSGGFNKTSGGNDPGSTTNPGAGFLMPMGYTMAWSGWDAAAGTSTAGFNATITLPIAKNPDGSSITGPSYEYIENDNATTTSYTLTYPPASVDQTKAQLTTRVHLNDVPQVVPTTGWAYSSDGNSISLLPAGTAFAQGNIYEFTYTAKDPTVNGIGFAAVRDFNSFIRYAVADDAGTANPMAGDITRIYSYTQSQPGRMLNDYRHLGFNADEQNRKVIDGMVQWVAAADGINMNLRFSQPGRTERNRQHHLYAEGVFPFANQTMTDPITGKTDGRYAKCSLNNTCPLAMEIYSANEYWVKAGSLFTTDPMGTKDLADPAYARYYLISSTQHGSAGNGTSKGACQQFNNPLDSLPAQRALFVALDQWSTQFVPPPPSMVPRFADGTLVPPTQAATGFPNIPGVLYTGLKTTRYLFNYGPRFDQGIMDIDPPVITPPYEDNPKNGPIYPSFVPKVDVDGNDIAGVRMPDLTVPLATYTGWGLRSAAFAGPDGCESTGQFIPFPSTAAQRIATGDPRRSVQERYPSFSAYYYIMLAAINQMTTQRLLLPSEASSVFNASLVKAMAGGLQVKPQELESLGLQHGLRNLDGSLPDGPTAHRNITLDE